MDKYSSYTFILHIWRKWRITYPRKWTYLRFNWIIDRFIRLEKPQLSFRSVTRTMESVQSLVMYVNAAPGSLATRQPSQAWRPCGPPYNFLSIQNPLSEPSSPSQDCYIYTREAWFDSQAITWTHTARKSDQYLQAAFDTRKHAGRYQQPHHRHVTLTFSLSLNVGRVFYIFSLS